MCTRQTEQHTVHIAVVITTGRRRARGISSFWSPLLPLSSLLPFCFSSLSLGLRCSLSNPIRAGRLSEGQQLQQRQLPSSPSHSLCQARTPGSVSVCVCSRVARLPDLKSQAASSETARKAAKAAVNPQGLQFNWSLPREE